MTGIQGEPVNHGDDGLGGWGLVRIARDGSLSSVPLADGAIVGGAGVRGDTIELKDSGLVAQHAQFLVRPDGVYISDLDSASGTRVDGLPVSMLGLAHGSVVRMGSTLALFAERDLLSHVGKPAMLAGEMIVGPRQGGWVNEAIEHVRTRQSLIVQGGPGIGKATLARVAIRVSGNSLPVHMIDGAGLDLDQLLRTFDASGPAMWVVLHIERMPRAAQSDLVRAIRATKGAMLIGTVVGAIEDAQAEGRIGASLTGLVDGKIIRVPDLEQRREDVPALTIELLRRMGVRLDEGAEAVFEAVVRAGWPGGVRELGTHLAAAFDAGGSASEAARILCRSVPRARPKSPSPLQESDSDLARARLRRALDVASGTVAVAARELKMSRQAFYRELRRLDVDGKKRELATS